MYKLKIEIMNKYFTLILTISLGLTVFAQNNTSESTKKDDVVIAPKDVSSQVKKQLKEVYGDYYDTYIKDQPGQIEFFTNFYKRCEFISLNDAPSGIKNISSLDIKEKYNPEYIYHDNLKTFNIEKFNVLKYQFNFYNKEDLYYRIYKTNTVLKINKLD